MTTYEKEAAKCYSNICKKCCLKCKDKGNYISCYVHCQLNQEYFDNPHQMPYIYIPKVPKIDYPKFEINSYDT
jgi:hypothetical protein